MKAAHPSLALRALVARIHHGFGLSGNASVSGVTLDRDAERPAPPRCEVPLCGACSPRDSASAGELNQRTLRLDKWLAIAASGG